MFPNRRHSQKGKIMKTVISVVVKSKREGVEINIQIFKTWKLPLLALS